MSKNKQDRKHSPGQNENKPAISANIPAAICIPPEIFNSFPRELQEKLQQTSIPPGTPLEIGIQSTQSIPAQHIVNMKVIDKLETILEHGDKEDQRKFQLADKERDITREVNLKHLEYIRQNSKENKIFLSLIILVTFIFTGVMFYITGADNFSVVKEILMGIITLIGTTLAAYFYGKNRPKPPDISSQEE